MIKKFLFVLILLISTACFAEKQLGDFDANSIISFTWTANALTAESIPPDSNGTITVLRLSDRTTITTGITNWAIATGHYGCTVDTNSDANYITGSDYVVWTADANIDGKIINAPLAQFSIENRYMRGTDSALPAASYTEPNNAGITAIQAKTSNLPSSPAAVGSEMSLTSVARETLVADACEAFGPYPHTSTLTTDNIITALRDDPCFILLVVNTIDINALVAAYLDATISSRATPEDTNKAILAPDGLKNISIAEPNDDPNSWDFRDWVFWLPKIRFGGKTTCDDDWLKSYNDADEIITKQSVSDVSNTQTIGKAQSP